MKVILTSEHVPVKLCVKNNQLDFFFPFSCLYFDVIIKVSFLATATPKYNSSILEDMFLEENSAFVKRVFLGWKDLQEALLLLKVCVEKF